MPSPPWNTTQPRSAFDGTAQQTLNDEALHEEEEEQDRQRDDAGAGHDEIPTEGVFLLEGGEPDRQSEHVMGLEEDEGEEKLVPGTDEAEHHHRRQSRPGKGENHAMEGAERRRTVDRGGILQLFRNRLEEPPQEPDGE